MLREAVSKLKSQLEGFINENNVKTNTLAIIGLVCIAVYLWMTRRQYNLPPGPRGLPILGYLPFLGKEAHKDFERLGKKYGNVFGLYLGQNYMVVLGDYETIKATLNQPAVLGRPAGNFGFSPDGAGFSSAQSTEWTEQRRFSVRAMRDIGLGGSKWEMFIQEEIEHILEAIQEKKDKPADHSKLFTESTSNNIMSLLFGQRLTAGHSARRLVNRVLELDAEALEISSLRNYFPSVANLFAKFGVGGQSKDLHSTFGQFAKFLKKQVEQRKNVYKDEASGILIDGYLIEIENNLKDNLNNTFNERNLRGTIMTLLTAGTDTSNASLLWLLLAMAQYPDVQAKVHRELDTVLGEEGKAKYTERSLLPYTFAVLQEGLRWATIAPLSLSREAMEDITVNGYDIPKGTWIVPNLYAIHKDTRYWKEPGNFIPERFLTDDGQLNASKIDGYLPFSYGKRNCPAETVAKMTIFLYFAAIMQRFYVLPPVGKTPKLEAKAGILYSPVHQELSFVTRE